MGNAGSMDSQQTDFRAHNVPLKLPMPEPGELEERFAIVLGPNAKYQKQEFCHGKDSKEGRWLILGNMQRERCAFSAF
ncbi:formin-like protein 2 [Leptonychotes weddellii]|uniref:Formin-like protein 2 n=1 Tax=Leptonychotes weddellii TaxID=9713 RepID=A0A7F8RD79_LEPWE|nr:formin-like protein 2 [Leptonychotes weddellii]